jgi:hypothetical protein
MKFKIGDEVVVKSGTTMLGGETGEIVWKNSVFATVLFNQFEECTLVVDDCFRQQCLHNNNDVELPKKCFNFEFEDLELVSRKVKTRSLKPLDSMVSKGGKFWIVANDEIGEVWTHLDSEGDVVIHEFDKTDYTDITVFGFELDEFEVVDFELTEATKKKLVGYSDETMCKLVEFNKELSYIELYHDDGSGRYDVITLKEGDVVSKTTFKVGDIK